MYKTRNKEKCNLKIEAISGQADVIGKTIDIIYGGAVPWNSIPTRLRNITSRKKKNQSRFKKEQSFRNIKHKLNHSNLYTSN